MAQICINDLEEDIRMTYDNLNSLSLERIEIDINSFELILRKVIPNYIKIPNVLHYLGNVLAFIGVIISLFANNWAAWVKFTIAIVAFVLVLTSIILKKYCNNIDNIVYRLKEEIGCFMKHGKSKSELLLLAKRKEDNVVTEYEKQIEELNLNRKKFKKNARLWHRRRR